MFTANDFGYWTITVERPLLDEDGNPVTDSKGKPKPDAKKRHRECAVVHYGVNTAGDAAAMTIKAYFEAAEVLLQRPRRLGGHQEDEGGLRDPHFLPYVPPRPLAEIDADLEKVSPRSWNCCERWREG